MPTFRLILNYFKLAENLIFNKHALNGLQILFMTLGVFSTLLKRILHKMKVSLLS